MESATAVIAILAIAICVTWYIAERIAGAVMACVSWMTRRERK